MRPRRAGRPKSTAPWILILSFLLLLLPLAACHKPSPEAVETAEAVPVTVATARSGPIRAVIAATGQVKPAAGAELLVMPPQEARIAALPKGVGDRVRRGEVLVRFEIPSLDADAAARRADLARGQAQLAAARQNVARLSGLFERGIAARREVEDAQRDLAQAEATVTEARSATAAAGRLAGREVVRAPFDGVVVGRSHQVGDLVDPSSPEPLLRVIDPSRLQVEAAVPTGDLGRVAVGSPARVRGAAFPDEAARVLARPAAVDPATGTALARLEFDSPTHRPAGLAVEVEIYGEERPAAVLVPAEALVQEGPESFVFVVDVQKVDAQKKAHRRQVEVGVTADGQAEILSGVQAGEAVVVRGQTALPDGALVETAEPADPSEPAP
ncbi:MAG TPA: efflux RND transporter periplasmic adaptor subunit [Thermoanaerobaculia bacterium]|nr:efflux RND transporter periplasmic adaptor subunit [Thermoanaerobaculia bacterium]